MANRVEALVEELARPAVESLGLELVDVEYVKEGKDWYLRLYIDRPDGVTLDDCTAASRAVEARLDAADPIVNAYSLEVSSPGLERPLKRDADFNRFAGRYVRLRTFAPVDGRRSLVGELLGLSDGCVRLRLPGTANGPGHEVAIPRDQVSKANLHVEI